MLTVPKAILYEFSELSELVNGTRKDYSVLVVDACGTENGQPAT